MPRRVLVVQTAFLGDVVLTTPLLRALGRVYPGTDLAVLVTPQAAPLVQEDPYLGAVLTYDKKGGESFRRILAKVRSGRFDVLVSAHRSHRTSLLAAFSGAEVRVGFSDAALSRAYSRRVDRPLALHEVDRNLELLRGLGEVPLHADRELHVGYTQSESIEVRRLLEEGGVGPVEPLAVLCPGSVWATKRWLPEGFAAVGKGLVARGFRVALLGGAGDAALSAEIADSIGPRALNAAGRTSLKAFAAWMDRAALLVTNDSAPQHVAAARGTPTVAIFGATTTGLGFGPFHATSRVVEASVACRPCGLHGGQSCPEGHFRCMREVTAEAVLAAADQLLAHPTPRPCRGFDSEPERGEGARERDLSSVVK